SKDLTFSCNNSSFLTVPARVRFDREEVIAAGVDNSSSIV
ncbi:9181_t:CDS:1, partial [Scutellospora calospora]